MPYTSTALIAREAGIPSIYYDPTGLLRKDDPAAHGIPVVLGKHELEQWIIYLKGNLMAGSDLKKQL